MEAGVCQGQPRPHFPSSIFPMDSPKSSKRLIAKNTVFLVGRSIFGILIGLYASRILLAKLGIENYGTYHIVGGVVVMFNSIRSLFTNAIQRYLNYSKGDTQKQNLIFNTGIQVQLILVGVFLIIAESIGLYAVLHLNLSEEQFKAAHVVYQLSVAAAVILMLTIPYDALIISKEKMNVFAWLSILGQVLSLGIIYLIGLGPFSLLVNYAILVFAVSLFLRYVSVTYCQRHFEESRIRKIHDKTLISEMTAFAGWNFLGRTGLYVSHQGIDYILNLTGGVVVNAARSITYSVMKGANALVGNANMAFKPQTNAAAANEDKKEFYPNLREIYDIWIDNLPITGDLVESAGQHDILCDDILKSSEIVFGENNKNVPHIIRILCKIVKSKYSNDDVDKKIMTILNAMKNNNAIVSLIPQAKKGASEKVKKKIDKYLS